MMHLAFPNVREQQFQGCVRYLSLSQGQGPDPAYDLTPAVPRTPNLTAVHTAVEILVPEWLHQGYTAQVYQTADGSGTWQGTSLDFAYLLALIRCARPLVLETLTDTGDVWCTGAIEKDGAKPLLAGLTRQDEFAIKLEAFCAQAHHHDRLFLVPAANVSQPQRALCEACQVQVLTVAAFRTALATALARGGVLKPAVILVGTIELPSLVAALFQPPSFRPAQRAASGVEPRAPYKFLDSFGPEDAEIFYGRDQESAEIQREFSASRLLILYGASGTGKTSLIQAGLLPSLPAERYAWVIVRVVDAHPIKAIKTALVNDLGIDRQYLEEEQTLRAVVRAAATTLRKTVVIVLDQGEEVFLRHAPVVRQEFASALGVCLDTVGLDVHVVITVREDYFGWLGEFRDAIPTVFHHSMRLTHLTPAQAFAAVVEPAKQWGWSIDATLVEEVVLPQLVEAGQQTSVPVDTAPGIDPPLLQIVCNALYKHAAEAQRSTIGAADYAALGDIQTILGRYLDTTLQRFGSAQRQVREVLKALVTAEHTKWAGFLEELVSRLHTAGVPLSAPVLEGFLRQLVQDRLVRATNVEGYTQYELSHEYLAGHIAAWLAEHERERLKVRQMIGLQYEVYRTTGLLLSQEGLAMVDKYSGELVWPSDQAAYLEASARHWEDRTQAEAEQKSRERDRVWLVMAVSLWSGLLGALTRMVLSWGFGSFLSLPGYPTMLSAFLNPAWHGFFGTWVGGILVVWVLETWLRDDGKLPLKHVTWLVIIGAAWGFGMSGIISGAFRPESLHILDWDTHKWGYPITGMCWGVGLAIGMYVGNTWAAQAANFASVLRQRYWGGLCGAVCCLLVSPLLIDVVFPEQMAMRRVWGEAFEQSFSVLAVLTWYYRHPLVARRQGSPAASKNHGARE